MSLFRWAARSRSSVFTYHGSNADYPDGDYATRSRIWQADQESMRDMTQFPRNDACVPDKLKAFATETGFQTGIFDDTKGWPHQRYVRESRRMKSRYVTMQQELKGKTEPDDSVGLDPYGVDDWHYATDVHSKATYVPDGKVAINGGEVSMLYLDTTHQGVYKKPLSSDRAQTRKVHEADCPYLLLRKPHCNDFIADGTVWIILGESAGVAAVMTTNGVVSAQKIETNRLARNSCRSSSDSNVLPMHEQLNLSAQNHLKIRFTHSRPLHSEPLDDA